MAQELSADVHMDQADEDATTTVAEVSTTPGATLLPNPIAGAVSLITRSSALYLRLGTFIGGLAIDGARATTLTGLELSRAIVEGILSRAGRDVADRSTGELGRTEAEGLLERSLATLHTTITSVSFVASTSFYFSAAALSSANDISQQLLGFLDAMLGSTDSSRAIASIITLIRREFQNPATGIEGEKVGVADLMMGMCGLALLQKWSQKFTDEEIREQGQEEVIWDVVILTSGRRAEVTDSNHLIEGLGDHSKPKDSSLVTAHGKEVLETSERNADAYELSEDDGLEIDLKHKIMKSLPSNASVSITTSTMTTKVMVVEIIGAEPADLTPPPGVEIIEEDASQVRDRTLNDSNTLQINSMEPRYRVVYQLPKINSKASTIQIEYEKQHESGASTTHDIQSTPSSLFEARGRITDVPSTMQSSSTTNKRPMSPGCSGNDECGRHMTRAQSDSRELREDSANVSKPSMPGKKAENVANQRKARKPLSSSASVSSSETAITRRAGSPPNKKSKSEKTSSKAPDVKSSIRSARNALKKGSGSSIAGIFSRDSSHDNLGATNKIKPQRPPWGSANAVQSARTEKSKLPIPQRSSNVVPPREAPQAPQRGNPNYFSSRDLGHLQSPEVTRSPSRASYVSIHERRRESMISRTDSYSIHSADQRPGSPTAYRTHLRAESNIMRTRSEKTMAQTPPSPSLHRRSKSYVPSIYTLHTNNSETSLVLASPPPHSAFDDSETLKSMARTGHVEGLFPQHHIVENLTRFMRFASASYGSSFLRVMGIASAAGPKAIDTDHHHEHHSFSHHTQLPADSILLSSFVDPQGGTDSSGHTDTGVPMVHFVSLDHDSKAVVLTCRGTLGFEDVLTDLTCDYDDLTWHGNTYRVHKGMLASAKRLMSGGGGRVLASIQVALEEFPDYGLVMCGHSLGGGVTSLLAILLVEPTFGGSAFVTASEYPQSQMLLPSVSGEGIAPTRFQLPPGRPIHVYAYGPPATMSPALRLATRGLVTTVVNGQDLVPYLSLGTLHDLQSVALAFKSDNSGAKGQVRSRVLNGFIAFLRDRWYNGQTTPMSDLEADDQWAYAALKALRSGMLSAKLVPPGEVFCVETAAVLKRDAFAEDCGGLGRPATRTILKYVRDVEKRFGELRFGGSMLLDHSPGRYEASLAALQKGVLGND